MHVGFLADPTHSETVRAIMRSIRDYAIQFTGISVADGWADSDETMNALLDRATHLVLLPRSAQIAPWMVYAAGFASGRRIPLAIVTEDALDGILSSATPLRADAVEMYLVSERASWEQRHRIDLARTRLRGRDRDASAAVAAAARGDEETVEDYLLVGMSPDARSERGVPLLVGAVRSRAEGIVQRLLVAGADPNAACGHDGTSALCEAASMGLDTIVGILLAHNADPNRRTASDQTALMLASSQGHASIVRHLIAAGGDADLRDSLGMSAREYARLFGKGEVEDLLARGASTDGSLVS